VVGVPRSSAASFSRRLLAAVSLVVVAAALATSPASAAAPTFPDACGSTNNFDYAVCERIDYMVIQQDDEQQSLTLLWWGIWTIAGLLIVLLIAPMFVDSFRFWR
jgi:hypothetical protein